MLLDRWYRPYVDLIFPRICMLCSKPIVEREEESICRSCLSEITPTDSPCLRCSAPLPAAYGQVIDVPKKCFYCERRNWSFRRAYCYAAYAGTAAKAARKIKQQSCEPMAIELGRRMGKWLQSHPPFHVSEYNFVVPVPQHWLRRATVRYNQAEVLAENVSRELGIPIRKHWLYRTRWTDKQGTKTIAERRTSLVDSFACKPMADIKKARFLVVDDIVTSGATAHEAAGALRKAGAAGVDVIAFARGVGAFQRSPRS